ncbi:peroxiredoxin [Insolitispirillum peregrinum]|uniref:thioredoxin-dependent peroxiredoxin n=1 Tax=Insolitispirillum peregrinum TaxID=80876 RepID=A0A1N7IHL2_9PROT|nr:peroxiredoxin [Insolitispirillum peregrinum]SIS36506.1 peroxiredoxin Q/BCP [Insolitispirillum peregrinum]
MAIEIGAAAPSFDLPVNGGGRFALAEQLGKPVVLYFYPKDLTSGCIKEAESFRDLHAEFQAAGAVVVGASRDPVKKHDQFVSKYDLPFPLLADEEGSLCEAYGVWVEKSMYGRSYMGIERTTVLIGRDGRVAQVWPKVKVAGHAAAVLEAVKSLG